LTLLFIFVAFAQFFARMNLLLCSVFHGKFVTNIFALEKVKQFIRFSKGLV